MPRETIEQRRGACAGDSGHYLEGQYITNPADGALVDVGEAWACENTLDDAQGIVPGAGTNPPLNKNNTRVKVAGGHQEI